MFTRVLFPISDKPFKLECEKKVMSLSNSSSLLFSWILSNYIYINFFVTYDIALTLSV